MTKQAPHYRKSKKGKPFKAGRGKKKATIPKRIPRLVRIKNLRALPSGEPDLFDEYQTGKLGLTQITEVDPKEFIEQRKKVPKERQGSLSDLEPDDLFKKGAITFMTEDKKAGAALSSEGEIMNVFSLEPGKGKEVMFHAIEEGGKKLDCFDGKLPKYYEQFGFKEVDRKENREKGGPDIVYMERE